VHRFTIPAVLILLSAGCADSPMVLQNQIDRFEQEQLALSRQQQQLQERAAALDQNNQQAQALLAQAQQESKLLRQQLQATRDQLRSVNDQLADARQEKQSATNQVKALQASLRKRGSTLITPNSSLPERLPQLSVPGVNVRRDGDVIRVELPGSELFPSGSARLKPGAEETIAQVADQLAREFPQQIIGVEGHTDSDPVVGGQWRNNHQLSVARAMTVYQVLVIRSGLKAKQLFISGHGANHPVVSNATETGKRRNRRVELVIYPEQI
jgi:flagellar motor protein MotB